MPGVRAVWKEFGKALRNIAGNNNRQSALEGAKAGPKEPTLGAAE